LLEKRGLVEDFVSIRFLFRTDEEASQRDNQEEKPAIAVQAKHGLELTFDHDQAARRRDQAAQATEE
jgi:hypothetical protein